MNNFVPLLCSEFKELVQQVLDGEHVSESYRRRIRDHRDSCNGCCGFHDSLLGVTAIASEIDPPAEFRNAQSSRLWNEIVNSVGEHEDVKPPRLDATKIDFNSEDGKIFDIAKFLFDPSEIDSFRNVIDQNNPNQRIDRVSPEVQAMLVQLQNMVATTPNVVGTMVLSPDGSVIDCRLGPDASEYTSEQISVWSTAAYHNAQSASEAFGYSGVKQIVSHTASGAVIIANLQGMTLVVLIDGGDSAAWQVVENISKLTK